jgi:hypothetical protein
MFLVAHPAGDTTSRPPTPSLSSPAGNWACSDARDPPGAPQRRRAGSPAAHALRLDCGRHLTAKSSLAWLADLALHLDSLDPTTIAAAALLECNGYHRANVQLILEIPNDTSII